MKESGELGSGQHFFQMVSEGPLVKKISLIQAKHFWLCKHEWVKI